MDLMIALLDFLFRKDFESRPDDYADGKISISEMRLLWRRWTAEAMRALMKRKDIIERAFKHCGVCNDTEGRERHLIKVPNFETYEPPTPDEKRRGPLTEEEIEEFSKKEDALQKAKKAEKKRKREEAVRERAKKRAKKSKKKSK